MRLEDVLAKREVSRFGAPALPVIQTGSMPGFIALVQASFKGAPLSLALKEIGGPLPSVSGKPLPSTQIDLLYKQIGLARDAVLRQAADTGVIHRNTIDQFFPERYAALFESEARKILAPGRISLAARGILEDLEKSPQAEAMRTRLESEEALGRELVRIQTAIHERMKTWPTGRADRRDIEEMEKDLGELQDVISLLLALQRERPLTEHEQFFLDSMLSLEQTVLAWWEG